MASIFKLAKAAASGSAKWAWKNSGAANVPVLSGAAGTGGAAFSRVKDRWFAPKKDEAPAPTENQNQKKNEEQNERSKRSSMPPAAPPPPFSQQVEQDIHFIRTTLEEQAKKKQNESGGGLLSGLLGMFGPGGAKGLLSKIPGVGRLGGLLAGAGAGAAGGGLLARAWGGLKSAGGAAGSMAGSAFGKIADVAKAGASSAAGVAKSAATGLGGLLSAGASKFTTVAEKGAGLEKAATGAAKASGIGSAVGKLASKSGLKSLIKKIPGIGLLAGIGLGAQRAFSGDFVGAGMEVASGVAGTVPGIGTAASLGIDAGLMARDAMKEGEVPELPKPTAAPANPVLQPASMQRDSVNSGIANLQAFAAAGLDEKVGIFVRPAKDALTDSSMPKEGFLKAKAAETVAKPSAAPSGAAKPLSVPLLAPGEGRGRGDPAGFAPSVPAAAEFTKAAPTTDLAKSDLGNLISRGEGDYNSYNAGTKGTGGKVVHSGKKDLSNMTLNEILESSEKRDGNDKDRVFAAGRYQIITPTLKDSMKKMGLKGDEKFTPELQDKIFQETLLPKSVKDYVGGKSQDAQAAQLDLAKVWRSFADPRTGKTYADAGAGANHASISPAESLKALNNTRAQQAKFSLDKPEERQSDVIKAETKTAAEAAKAPAAAPIVVPVAAAAPKAPATAGGGAGISGHMGTRNDDSSIRRITDAKMGYSSV